MGIDFYYSPFSPPCMAVMCLARALKIDLNEKEFDLRVEEHKKPEFLKLNPQHTVPTLVDNSFSIWESRAIMQYLCDKYARNDHLYPRDAQKRAVVNRFLYYDIGTYHMALHNQYMGKEDVEGRRQKFEEALTFLNDSLEGKKWLTGEQMTIADISLYVSTYTLTMFNFDFSSYPNVQRWIETGKTELPGFDAIDSGTKFLGEWIKKMYMPQPQTLPEEIVPQTLPEQVNGV